MDRPRWRSRSMVGGLGAANGRRSPRLGVRAALSGLPAMTERLQRLAQFCVDTRFEDLPAALVAQAKRHILDTFGATLAGADSDVARQARRVFEGETGRSLGRSEEHT